MAYVDPNTLEDDDIALIYIAGKTAEAKRVEHLLTAEGIDYTLKSTPFLRSTLFGGTMQLPGLGFYVLNGQAARCRILLQAHKFRAGLVGEGEE